MTNFIASIKYSIKHYKFKPAQIVWFILTIVIILSTFLGPLFAIIFTK